MAVMHDTGTFLPRDNAVRLRATANEVRQITELIKRGLDEGALGIGYGINYVPQTIFDLFRLAAERKVTNFVHMRHGGAVEPGSAIAALQEVLADAAATGASLHVVHITSTVFGRRPTVCR